MAKKLYVVERRSWDVARFEEVPVSHNTDDAPHGVPVVAFTKRAAATKRCKELTAAARLEVNPFQLEYCEIELLTSVDEEALIDRVIELGLVPPHPDGRNWLVWYDDLASQLTDAQRDGVWDALDKLVLYAVVPVELEE